MITTTLLLLFWPLTFLKWFIFGLAYNSIGLMRKGAKEETHEVLVTVSETFGVPFWLLFSLAFIISGLIGFACPIIDLIRYFHSKSKKNGA